MADCAHGHVLWQSAVRIPSPLPGARRGAGRDWPAIGEASATRTPTECSTRPLPALCHKPLHGQPLCANPIRQNRAADRVVTDTLRFKLTGGSLDSATAIQDLLDHKDGQAASSCLSAGGISPSGCALRGMPASSAIAAPSLPTGSLRWRARPFGATGVAFFDQLQANDKWKSSNGDFLADAGLRPAIAHQEPNLGTAVPESARQLFATAPSDI